MTPSQLAEPSAESDRTAWAPDLGLWHGNGGAVGDHQASSSRARLRRKLIAEMVATMMKIRMAMAEANPKS